MGFFYQAFLWRPVNFLGLLTFTCGANIFFFLDAKREPALRYQCCYGVSQLRFLYGKMRNTANCR